MTLSIVIPTKNEDEYLPTLLSSIKKQTFQPLEVIVADADSDDSTREIAQKFGAKVVKGGMPGSGRNNGAKVSKGDYIFFLDADVELDDKYFLEKAISEMIERELDIATADVRPIGGNKYDVFSHKVYNVYVRLFGNFRPHAPGFCIFVKRTLHEKINGFDESVIFAEDQDYTIRGNKAGKFGFLSNVVISVSIRRQERDGRLNMGIKYFLADLHFMIFGPIRHNLFNYTFGYPKKETYAREK